MGAAASITSSSVLAKKEFESCPEDQKESALALYQKLLADGRFEEDAIAECKRVLLEDKPDQELNLQSFQRLVAAPRDVYRSLLAQACAPTSPYRFKLGVTVHFFEWLRDYVRGKDEDISPDITTEQLVWGQANQGPTGPSPIVWSIAGECKQSKESFISWCVRNKYTHNDAGEPFFAPVTTFASHAWQGKFLSFADTMQQHAKGSMGAMGKEEKEEGPSAAAAAAAAAAFFVDIFIINQHIPPWCESPPLLPNMVLQPPIEHCRSSLLVLSPFEAPIPLTRSWCIYEINTTKQLGASLDIGIPGKDQSRFTEALSNGQFDFNMWVQRIDIEKAQATRKEDRDIILNLVRKGSGVVTLNKLVIAELCSWLNQHGQATLQALPVEQRAPSLLIESMADMLWRQGRTREAEALMSEIVRGRREQLGMGDERTLSAMHTCGKFLRTQGHMLASEEMLSETIQHLTKLLGETHPKTLNSMRELAVVKQCQGKFEDSEEQLRVVLSRRNEACSELEEEREQLLGQLQVQVEVEEKSEGKNSDQESAEKRGESLPPDQQTALDTLQKKIDEQRIEYYDDIFALIGTLRHMKKFSAATELMDEVISGRSRLLGPDHPRTLDAYILRGKLRMTNADESAISEMRDVLSRLQGMLGGGIREGVKGEGEHYKAVDCLLTLAQMLAGREQFDEALQTAEEAARCLKLSFGDAHPDTIGAVLLVQKISKLRSNSNSQQQQQQCSEEAKGGGDEEPLSPPEVLVWKGSTVYSSDLNAKGAGTGRVKLGVEEVKGDMALVFGASSSQWVDISSLRDAHERVCTGSAGPARDGHYWAFEKQVWEQIPPAPDSEWFWWDEQQLEWCMAQGCFNGDAVVTLADGVTRKAAREVRVGDAVATVDGSGVQTGSSHVLGICVQSAAHGQRIKINNLLLSLKHRIMHEGAWIEPQYHPLARAVTDDGALFNLVVEHRLPILVEGIVASTIGTYCDGSHQPNLWSTHRLWGSEKIVSLFRLHPQWPNILLDGRRDNFLSVLKSAVFAEKCCEADPDDYLELLVTHGWNCSSSGQQSPSSHPPPLLKPLSLKEKMMMCQDSSNSCNSCNSCNSSSSSSSSSSSCINSTTCSTNTIACNNNTVVKG